LTGLRKSEAKKRHSFVKDMKRYRFYFMLMIPGLLVYLVFRYLPMFGISIAFQEYRLTKGFLGSEWVGLKHFIKFFTARNSLTYVLNTLMVNVYGLLFGFPVPVLFAIMLSEVRGTKFRKAVQTVSFLPHFISTVITVNLITMLFHINDGVINRLIATLGGTPIDFLTKPQYYRSIYVASGIWSGFGWSSIIYLAAILGIDPGLYESAMIDGANAGQRIWHITLPCIRGTIMIMLILEIGGMLGGGTEKALLLQKPTNLRVSETIATYVYKRGILASGGGYPEFSYTTAIGISQSLVNIILLTSANYVSRRITEVSLF
jgi:putative aldouronate transport system permease protein